MTTVKSVHLCLLIVELAISIFFFITLYWLLKLCLPFSDGSLAATTSTLSALWLAHVTQRTVRQLSRATGQDEAGGRTERNESDNAIKELQSKMYRGCKNGSCCSCKTMGLADSPVGTEDQCPFITDAKFLIGQSKVEEGQGQVTIISLTFLAVFATVILQCSVRFFTLLHSIIRSLRRRRQAPSSSLISFFDIPFTIGNSMSLGGRSFFISYVLDRWLCRNDQVPPDRNMDMAVQAVSFDQILINSSHLFLEKSGRRSCTRLGVSLGGIEFRITVRLKQSQGTKESQTNGASQTSVHSMTMSIRIESLDFSLYPSIYQVKARGLNLEGNVAFHTDDISQTNNAVDSNHKPSTFGLGMSHEFREVQVQLLRCANNRLQAGSLLNSKIDQNTIISWNPMQSTLYIRETSKFTPHPDKYNQAKKVVLLMEAPAGNIVLHASPQSVLNHRSKQASVLIGHAATIDVNNHCCRFAIALDVQSMPNLILAMSWILRDITTSLSVVSVSGCNDGQHTQRMKKSTPKQNTTVDIVAFDASFCSCFYAPCNKQGVNAFYLTSSNMSFSWRNTAHLAGSMSNCITQRQSMRLSNVNLHYYDKFRLDIILLDEIRAKLVHQPIHESITSNAALSTEKYPVADTGNLVVRINDKTIKQISQLSNSIEQIIGATKILNSLAAKSKGTMNFSKNQSSQSLPSTKRSDSRIKLSCKYVDVVMEFQPHYYNDEDLNLSDNTRIRVALLQRKILAELRHRDSKEPIHQYQCGIEHKLPPPNQMFEYELKQHRCAPLTEFTISKFEASVTFYPHTTLPVVGERTRNDPEITFYVQAQGLSMKLAASSKSQIMFTSATELQAYELVGPLIEPQPFSNPVCDDNSDYGVPSAERDNTGWPMLRAYHVDNTVDKMVMILTCAGQFCRVEKNGQDLGEKQELLSIHLHKGPSDLRIYWSTVLMWMQASCNERIQRAIGYVKESLLANSTKLKEHTSRTTQLCILIDPNAPATFHTSLGKKTAMHIFVENGMDLNLTMAKHKSTLSSLKPNILINASRVMVSFNDIKTPTVVIGDICFRNTIRRATSQEISEYMEKREIESSIDKEIVTDWDGHPTKELFYLKMGSCTAKFHPNLFFGEVIDDLLMTPRAVDIGLDSMKHTTVKRAKKYQLMSINAVFAFVDASLLDVSSSMKNTASNSVDDLALHDIARIYFEQLDVSIERNTPPRTTQSIIAALDEDASSYTYGPSIQGGRLHLTINHATATLFPLNLATPLARINDFDMKGHLFLSALSTDTPGIGKGRTSSDVLMCHHCLAYGYDKIEQRKHKCCYGITSHSSGIPVKVYTSCHIRCSELDANYGPVMNLSIAPLIECIQRLLPPSPPEDQNGKPDPLTWWDNIRFFLHGNIGICTDTLSVRWLLDSEYYLDQSLLLICHKCQIDYCLGFFGINAIELNVSVPGISYNMTIHPSHKRDTPHNFLPHEIDAAGEDRHPVLFVPSISIKMKFKWKMLVEESVSSTHHHSPYVNCPNSINNKCSVDKFVHFRSDGLSDVSCEVELPGTDLIGNWILLRIDVLPWFTHVNSAATQTDTSNEHKSDSFPQFRSLDISANVNDLRMATWFADDGTDCNEWDDNEAEGLCITVKSLSYINIASSGDKDLTIEGPVKAALLDVSEFIESLERYDTDDTEMEKIERACQNYGGNFATDFMNSNESTSSGKSSTNPFFKLQELTQNIDELDYVVNAGQIDIQNRSLQSIMAGSRVSLGSEDFAGVNKITWSILVSQLKILWTLEIRDSLMSLVQDYLFTSEFMKAQLRQSLTGEQTAAADSEEDINQSDFLQRHSTEEGVEVTLSPPETTQKVGDKSRLEYLLHRKSNVDLDIDGTTFVGNDRASPHHSEHQKIIQDSNLFLPTIDIHFSNPQVQLHRKSTGGSIILAMEGAHIEGRKFLRFLVDTHKVKETVSPSDLTRRTVHNYTLTNMSAYSLDTKVDVAAGLPWLEVYVPGNESIKCNNLADTYLEKRGRIESKASCNAPHTSDSRDHFRSSQKEAHKYPPHLRHHEPLAFLQTSFCSPILNKFTFKSRQSFHRPPIHYSKDELLAFIKQGLFCKQNDDMVDEVDLKIDLLNFTLDSYQFKTTFDIIRNVLLEPPKPHRHRGFSGDENGHRPPVQRARVSSVAAAEMEEILENSRNHIHAKHGREILRSAAMNLLRDIEDRHALSGDTITRRVSYTLKKLKWRIHSPDSIDDVEIAFTGFFGKHDYSSDGSVSTQFGLEDVRVRSSKPGPDSISFPDPTSVIKPVLNERSPCVVCGKRFDHSFNDLTSCTFHDGKFISGVWSCCSLLNATAPGCKYGPHTGKERAATVRIEALPRMVEGITLYSHFEVNVFPETPHTTIVQISKSLSKLFMNYFFQDEREDTKTTSDKATESISLPPGSDSRQKALLIGGKGYVRESVQTEDSDDENSSSTATDSHTELVLIKVWRVGCINAEISLAGFRRIPQRTVDIRVHDYSRAYKIGSWGYLGQKYLTFLIQETLKSGASSAIFRRKITVATSNDQSNQAEMLLSKPSASFENDRESSIIRHSRVRPFGAETFLGTAPGRAKGKSKTSISKK